MTPLIKTLVAVAATALPVAGAFAQSTVVDVENEPAPSLTVRPPLPGPLAQGVVFIPYQLENLRIVPVGGATARDISPRVGHLHRRTASGFPRPAAGDTPSSTMTSRATR
jgi:hypothetical protein